MSHFKFPWLRDFGKRSPNKITLKSFFSKSEWKTLISQKSYLNRQMSPAATQLDLFMWSCRIINGQHKHV